MGTAWAVAPAPTPPWHVLGGVVHTVLVPSHSAAQNMSPSIPFVTPGPDALGATVFTYVPVDFCNEVS